MLNQAGIKKQLFKKKNTNRHKTGRDAMGNIGGMAEGEGGRERPRAT